MSQATVVLDRDDMCRTLVRIAHEIVEKNPPNGAGETISDPGSTSSGSAHREAGFAIVGIYRRGAILAQRLQQLTAELTQTEVPLGLVDISFYRDDIATRAGSPVVHSTALDFAIDGRTIVVVDDVLYTGRTVRAAIDVIFDYGRPARVQLATLIDRGHRELPIRPDYVGKNLPTAQDQRVNVRVQDIDGVDEVTVSRREQPGDAR